MLGLLQTPRGWYFASVAVRCQYRKEVGRGLSIAGDDVRAKEAIAESYYLKGGIHEAALQLQELARREDLDYYQRARITARINELRLELAKLGLEEP